MKALYLLGITLMTGLAAALSEPSPILSLNRISQDHSLNLTSALDISHDLTVRVADTATDNEQWAANVARGKKLLAAMKGTDLEAATIFQLGNTANSKYDGDLRAELREWGWNDNTDEQRRKLDSQCDFVAYHKIGRCFEELGLGTKSTSSGGPNECFVAEHWDGPTVKKNLLGKLPEPKDQRYEACDGAKYWVTGGYYCTGINAAGGAIMVLDHKSPARGAEQLWGRKPKDFELPHIRAASDMTWAFWNRATAGGDIKNIKYFFVCLIVNLETQAMIRRAHETMTPPKSAPGAWPGTEFSMDSEQGLALLGSPLGRSHGFFLMQHKAALGGSKFIAKVRVFKNDAMSMPYMLFYVQDPSAAGGEAGDDGVQAMVQHVYNSTLPSMRGQL